MGYGGIARRLALGAGAGLCGLALMAFQLPIPVPSVTPTAPVPLPSIPVLQSGSSGGGSQQQQPTAPQAVAPATSGTHHTTAPTLDLSTAAPAVAVAAAADGPLQTQANSAVNGIARSRAVSGSALAGGRTRPPGGGPLLPQPGWLLAAFAVVFGLLMIRLAPLPRRPAAGVKLEVTPSTEAAFEAALRLCESMLPEGATVRRSGAALSVAGTGAARADLDAALAQISRRAHRVGLGVEPAAGSDTRPQLAPA